MKKLMLLLPLLLCASCINFTDAPQTHYYLLEPMTVGNQVFADNSSTINIQISEFPELLERYQLVLKDRENMVEILSDERWADPLDNNIQTVIRDNLQQQMPNALINAGLWQLAQNPDGQIEIRIKRFIGKPGSLLEVEIAWQYSMNGKIISSGRFSDRQQAGASTQELIGGLNASLNRFCIKLAAELNQ
jgi:uncharacterized lipoprotein YmbA